MDQRDVIGFSVEERSRIDLLASGFFKDATPLALDRAMGPVMHLDDPALFENDVVEEWPFPRNALYQLNLCDRARSGLAGTKT